MDVDYKRLDTAVATTMREIREGAKDPVRRPRARIDVVRDLQGEVTAGAFRFRTDAAVDAGGFGQHPRPMDYLLGALASCVQMWCLRWAAQRGIRFTRLVIEAESVFDWRGEYLQETDAGASELHLSYEVDGHGLTSEAACEMADVVARRCPVLVTLRRAAPILERLQVATQPVMVRRWAPGTDYAVAS
ncbi:MAG: OsmC family protein [Burkholderiales bacterium]|nr:OsmC family protein [Burkholderiales bacterium]